MTRQFYSMQEAADVLGVHLNTLRSYVQRGEIPARKLQGRVFIRVSDIENIGAPYVVAVA